MTADNKWKCVCVCLCVYFCWHWHIGPRYVAIGLCPKVALLVNLTKPDRPLVWNELAILAARLKDIVPSNRDHSVLGTHCTCPCSLILGICVYSSHTILFQSCICLIFVGFVESKLLDFTNRLKIEFLTSL